MAISLRTEGKMKIETVNRADLLTVRELLRASNLPIGNWD